MSAIPQPAERRKIRIGDLLVEHNIINQEQLGIALKEQKKLGRKLGQTLIALGFLSENDLLDFLSRQLSLPFIDLVKFEFNTAVVQKLSESLARRYRAIVLQEDRAGYLVGMADPMDIYAYDDIVKALGSNIRLAIVRESELLDTFDRVYRRTSEIKNLAEELGQELSEGDNDLVSLIETGASEDAPVVRLLTSLFEDAVQVGASDIHIEPDESVLRIRQRVDGMLQEQIMNEKRIASAVVLRLKIMCGLDISEKRIPQDGRFNMRVKKHEIDVRLSTMPTQHGESVVMRLLDQTNGVLDLSHLGMDEVVLEKFRRAFHHPHGLVLVTGPTGSGKTTTLYSALRELNKSDKKIITAEDPVEYRLPRVNQVQVNSKIGLDFRRILRTALRQDPDVILIGEMRDKETIEIGMRAAMTGHMVLSSLHTNDAVSTVDRLVDMGAEGFLIATTLHAVIAQRLLRKICTSCVEEHMIDDHYKVWLRTVFGEEGLEGTYKKGTGCQHCNHTGYKGRIGVYEVLEFDSAMRECLRRNDTVEFFKTASNSENYQPMRVSALAFARSGLTSLDEVMRITAD